MSKNDYQINIPEFVPTFIFAVSLDSCTDEDEKLGRLLSSRGWYRELYDLNNNDDFLSEFTSLSTDLPNYRDAPSPEKRPINDVYFDKHKSISTEYSVEEKTYNNKFKIDSIFVRLFEHGGITTRCTFNQTEQSGDNNIDEAVSQMRELRNYAQQVMHQAINSFLRHLDHTYDQIEFTLPEGPRAMNNFERYEYLDVDLIGKGEEVPFEVYNVTYNDNRIQELKELIGLCRMSKPYAWPNHAPDFLREYMRKDLGNRGDELWFINSQRFIRYFPDSEVAETSDYAQDIILSIEVLISLRSVYKSMIEKIREELGELPSSLLRDSVEYSDFDESDIHQIQTQLSVVSYRLSRCRFPSILRYHAQGQFAVKLFSHIEEELQLPQLSETLETEMEKFHSAVDSFGSIVTHYRDIQLQRRILVLTVVVGLVGAVVTLISIFFS